jgi:phenylpyruvate tautomerase PptA (4-oxalocrotonate tautomerase family)
MPVVRIDVRKARTQAEIEDFCEAVHRAVVEALKVPETDRQIVYTDHTRDRFLSPPGKTDLYTLVEVVLFSGRSLDTKRAFYRAVVANLGELGVPASEIFIVLNEQPRENWGIRGGQAACDVDLGFKVDV